MQERLKKYGLEIETSKSRILEFGRYAEERRKRRGEGKPETFDFLGFTFYCGKTQAGKFCVVPKTNGKRFGQKLKEMKQWLKQNRTTPLKVLMPALNRKLLGHYRYYGVTYNVRSLIKFHYYTTTLLYRWMNRRSQKKELQLGGIQADAGILPTGISQEICKSLCVACNCECYYEEPYAGKPHVRIWKGFHIVRCDFTKLDLWIPTSF